MRKEVQFICLLIFILCGCSEPTDKNIVEYSFFVAGHTYGEPGVDNVGLHPPFKAKFDLINNDSLIRFGVLTGDIVPDPTQKNWDEIDEDLACLKMPVYFAAGNHDLIDRELFEKRYGKTYFSFKQNSDLFIVLDPNIDSLNISGQQLSFLKRELKENQESVNNIFIFFHQVLWWEKDNKYGGVHINPETYGNHAINFFTEIEPLFKEVPNQVVMFSGDVGAFYTAQEFMYHKYDNITLIASGMGGNVRDNFIIIDVNKDKTISYRLIALSTEDINGLGKLEDYVLPERISKD